MKKIIDDLLNQNEQFIDLLVEMQQSSSCKTGQFYEFMLNTARKSIDYGMALSAYEIEMKKLTEHNLPNIVDYNDLLNQSQLLIDYYAKENEDLKRVNNKFSNDIQLINAELINYKSSVYNLMLSNNNDNLQSDWKLQEYFINFLDFNLN